MPAKNHIELIVKTLAVLECLAASEQSKALKEIAAEVGLVKSSVFRILFTLREQGYVEQSDGGNYRLTLKSGRLARKNTERLRLADIARPYLIKLRDDLDESVALAERRPHAVVLIDVQETSHPLRLSFQIGDDCPIHATALGKAVAAFLPTAEFQTLWKGEALPQYTARTNTKATSLRTELAKIRTQGYSFNNEETVTGAFLVGAPIFDANGTVCGAISVNSPTVRCTTRRKQLMISDVVKTAKQISQDLSDVGLIHSKTISAS